ncbi:unnamed protein product [Paramecium pentaurelia]|uniref:Uncharacterized protein n=1 Tax=Paramecium pentaurelia TaxID=43138 RepID=A0A8S1V074_9CILI|nr:unnamed protein product [Paramecium pentaurelia]
MDFMQSKNIECDNLINDLNTYVDSLNQSFSLLKMEIRQKYSLQKEGLNNNHIIIQFFLIDDNSIKLSKELYNEGYDLMDKSNNQVFFHIWEINMKRRYINLYVHIQNDQINIRMQSLGCKKHSLLILSMFIPYLIKDNAQDCQINMRIQSLDWIKQQLLILSMLIPQVIKGMLKMIEKIQ